MRWPQRRGRRYRRATAPRLAFAPDGKAIYVMSVDDTANAPYWGKVYEIGLD